MEGQKLRELSKKDSFLQSSTVYSAGQLCGVKSRPNDIRQFVRAHKNAQQKWTRAQIDERIEELMTLIGLQPSSQFLTKYPHQLSGGQRQRILMARAISLDPKLIVADEPVSMIDVSLRLSLLNLMKKLNEQLGMSFVYISHDLSTTRYIARNGRVAVMYLGEIAELGNIGDVVRCPRHPYTRALIQAVPIPDPDFASYDELPLKSMNLGSLENRSDGCSFTTDVCILRNTVLRALTTPILPPLKYYATISTAYRVSRFIKKNNLNVSKEDTMKQHTRTNLMLIAILTFVLAVGALLATSIVLKPDATADSPASDVILSQDFNGDGIPEGWEDLIGSVEDGMGLINSIPKRSVPREFTDRI